MASSRTERLLVPARQVGIADTAVFVRLASLMPPHSTYQVVALDPPPAEFAGGYIYTFLNYWLLPRRRLLSGKTEFTIYLGRVPENARALSVTRLGSGVTLVRDR
jgi:hypothetical protein